MSTVIQVENLSKSYRLGTIGGGTLRADVSRWLAKLQGKPDPTAKIGSEHHARLMGTEFWALQDVNFEVKQGEILGIIGRNGAGKSTLLKILSRVTAPTSGEVRVKGRIASLLEVGTGFHPELTGRENIFLNGAILGMSKAEIKKQFDEIVAFSGVEDFIDTPVKRYSSGMYVRLAFAVAAHLEPEILIVDEVLAVGDAEFQKKCLGKMQDVSTKEGRTVLFVSHHVAAISKLTSRCLVMANGSIALDGPTKNAVEAYFQAAAHEKPVSYQLQKAHRLPGGNQAATFVSAHFTRPRPLFESGEDLEFGVSLRAHKNVSDLRFSMTVCSLDGTPVGTTCGREGFDMQGGTTGEFQVRLPQPRLAPGHYFCVVAIGSGFYSINRVDFDIVADTLHFEVATAASGANAVAYWNENWGKVVFPDVQMTATMPPQATRPDRVSTGNPMGA